MNPKVAVAEARADMAAINTRSNKMLCNEVGKVCCSEQVVAA